MTDNEALIAIVLELESFNRTLSLAYDDVTGDATARAVTSTSSSARVADATAVKTIVTNTGAQSVQVFEDGILVAIVPAGTSRELPLTGLGVITWKCASGQSSTAAIATYQLDPE